MATQLKNIKTLEVSLVDKGANLRTFVLTKAQGAIMEKYLEMLKKFAHASRHEMIAKAIEAAADEKKFEAFLKSLDEKDGIAVKSMFNVLKAVDGDPKEEIAKSLVSAIGLDVEKVIEKKAKPEPKPDPIKKDDPSDQIPDDIPEPVKKELESIRKEREEMAKQLKDANEKIAKEEDIRLTNEYIAKAAGYPNIITKADNLGMLMKAVAQKCPDEFPHFEDLLKKMDVALKNSELFKERGSSGVSSGNDALSKLTAMADAMVAKSGAVPITKEQAFLAVVRDPANAELYQEYKQQMQQ